MKKTDPDVNKKSSTDKTISDNPDTNNYKELETSSNEISKKSKEQKLPSDKQLQKQTNKSLSAQEIRLSLKQQKRREERLKKPHITQRQKHIRNKQPKNRNQPYNNDLDDNTDISHQQNTQQTNMAMSSGNHSGNQQQNDEKQHNDDDNKENNSETIKRHHKRNEFDNHSQQTTDTQFNKNTQDYLGFLKQFASDEFETFNQTELEIKKAMTYDAITQMFDQFIMGMDQFSKETKQHHIFGRGAHLCQKILLSLKENNMPEAQKLIQKIIPK